VNLDYDPAADRVHGSGWNSAERWGGWTWREPRYGDHFRTCSFCGCIHPEDLAAELVAQGPCAVCGQVGWEACFRAQKAHWMTDDKLAELDISGEERARIDALNAAHSYDPGGAYASWADQKYGWPHKFYVEGLKPRDPALLHVLSHHHGPDKPGSDWPLPGRDWIAAADLTPEQLAILEADGYDRYETSGWYAFWPRPTLHAKFYTIHLADPAISRDVKDKIQQASGLRLTFTDDGKVSWERWS
jgi:hypothetical protein